MANRVKLVNELGETTHDVTAMDSNSLSKIIEASWPYMVSTMLRHIVDKGIADQTKSTVTVKVIFS